MASLACCYWWLLLGFLLGWIAAWLIGRNNRPMLAQRITQLEADLSKVESEHRAVLASRDGELSALKASNGDLGGQLNRLHQDLGARGAEISAAQARIAALEAELAASQATPVASEPVAPPLMAVSATLSDPPLEIDVEAAKAVGIKVSGADDLVIIEGIGPKIAELLRNNGVSTFADLARMTPESIKAILNEGGPNFQLARPDTWPEQAALVAANRWVEFKALTDQLNAGKRS